MEPATRSRRADILAAATHEFAAAGYAGARMDRVAAAAGVNKQLLFHYFGSKDGLFAAAVGALLEQFDLEVPSTLSPVERIRAVLARLGEALRAVPGFAAIAADASLHADFPRPAAAALREWRRRLEERLVAAVEDGQRRGYFRDDLDPRAVARVAAAGVLGNVALEGSRASGTGGASSGFEEELAQLLADYCAWR